MTGEDPHRVPLNDAAVTRRQALFDLALTLLLCTAYVAAENLSLPKRWIMPAIGFALLGFIVHLYRRGGESWSGLGFCRAGLAGATKEAGAFTLLATLLILGDNPLQRF